MATLAIMPRNDGNRSWARSLLIERWQDVVIVTRGIAHRADELPAFAAELESRLAGLITFRISGDECEIVSLDSTQERRGVGTALLNAALAAATQAGCRRVWLVTTNDNLPALEFFQKRGYRLAAVYPGAIEQARRLKPQLPQAGWRGIPLRDELELERVISGE